jgi:apolipoprotein N-acyltransferase
MPYALSLLAGALLPLAFAPFEQFWLAPLSYAVLLYLWKDVASSRAFGLGFAFGCASFGFGTYWTFIAVRIMGGAPVAVAVFLTVGLVFICAAFVGLAGFIAARWFRTSGVAARLVTLPALFVLCEWLRGWAFTGFGWLSAGYSQTSSWLMGYAPILGLHAMSWAVLVTAGAIVVIAETVVAAASRRRYAGALAAVLVVAAVWVAGLAARAQRWTVPQQRTLSVALLQGDVAQDLKWKPEQLTSTLDLYARLTVQNLGTELIVWPEAAVPTLMEYVGRYVDDVRRVSAARGSTVLLGILRGVPDARGESVSRDATGAGSDTGSRGRVNSHGASDSSGDTGSSDDVSSDGDAEARGDAGSRESDSTSDSFQNVLIALTDPMQTYVKRHLVPFGEYFPVPSFIRSWMRLMSLPYTDATPGAPDQPPLDAAGQRIAVTICYEDVFGAEQLHYLPDATLLVDVSNDAWFGDSIAPHQHLQIAQVRAAEAGRYLLRATNTGVTAVIDDRGNVEQTLPQFKPAVLKATVRGFDGATPYARVGNWLVVLAALAAVLTQWRRLRGFWRPSPGSA